MATEDFCDMPPVSAKHILNGAPTFAIFNQSINQVYFQINMYKNEQKVHISQIDRKKVEVEVNNL